MTMKKRGAPGSRWLRPEAEWTAWRPEGPANGARSRRDLDTVAEGAQRDNEEARSAREQVAKTRSGVDGLAARRAGKRRTQSEELRHRCGGRAA